MNNQQRQQVLEQIKSAKHVLVTVSSNPTVDELAASIGLTLAINKMDKHATTVFSGIVPSTIEFLQPEKTIETTTDSLRDFIIALDKSKADKLRYKVEDDVVRIFITPYRTTITDKDLEFSQGDFNVDLVIALGVTKRQDLDKAITAHGRILHDATILALTKREVSSELGAINWQDAQASSLCEMVASVLTEIEAKVIDGQMATAFLTGIIAETDRFKNEKTTPLALSLSSTLMSAGANQQLIAEKLDEPAPAPQLHREEFESSNEQPQERVDGELAIDHKEDSIDKIHIDDNGNLNLAEMHQQEENVEPQPELPAPSESLYEQPESFDNSENLYNNNDDDNNDDDGNVQTDSGYVEPQTETEHREDANGDIGSDLFDDLSSKDGTDGSDEPTLKQPDSSDTPMMQHGKVIAPPTHPGDIPKSDKPFDPLEAMQEPGINQQIQPSAPQIPQVLQTPQPVQINESQSQSSDSSTDSTPTTQNNGGDSLADLEKAIGSSHVTSTDEQAPTFPAPPPELQQVQESIQPQDNSTAPPLFPTPLDTPPEQPISFESPKVDSGEVSEDSKDPNAPPPVPPPMSPQFYDADGNNSNPFQHPQP
jgi:hypothetical protein